MSYRPNLSVDYPFVIAAYLAIGLAVHNRRPHQLAVTDPASEVRPAFMPGRMILPGLTSYGAFAAIGVFLAATMVSRCGISTYTVAFVVALPLLLRYVLCSACSSTYNITLVYALAVPLMVLLFPCADIAVIVAALAVASAFGRLGCISAGCCAGPRVSCSSAGISYAYQDPGQIVNRDTGTIACCEPTAVYEAIGQFVIAGLCLRFPEQAPAIFGVATGVLVAASGAWRERPSIYTTAAILLFLAVACMGQTGTVCATPQSPRLLEACILAALTAYVLSNDVMLPTGGSTPATIDTDQSVRRDLDLAA